MGQEQSFAENLKQCSPPTIAEIANKIQTGKFTNIIVLAGAGVSTSCGIPDFRSPGGIYDNLSKYNLPTPQSIFTLSYFRENPQAFYTLAKDLYPGKYKPSETHRFFKWLQDKKTLLRVYTQNIDGLEELAGVSPNLIVQAHGGFSGASCIDCKHEFKDLQLLKTACESSTVLHCVKCNGLVKPNIVFFGESLPRDFGYCVERDFPKCDLLLVFGSSLSVFPFASLIAKVRPDVPRVLINREMCGTNVDGGFLFEQAKNERDVFLQCDCDAGASQLQSSTLYPDFERNSDVIK